jgi:MFS family permease
MSVRRAIGLGLPRTVWLLGAASLLNDAAAEMIAPLLPLLLTVTLGASPAVLGLIEGMAEAAASLLKLYSGRLADRGWPARTLVIGGYGVSNLARPLIGLAGAWPLVLALRITDRIGKGLRTAPRDALLAGAVGAPLHGRAFGLHRTLDHGGAVLGPLLAAALLAAGLSLAQVFVVSLLPGLAVLGVLALAIPRGTRTTPPPEGVPALRWRGLDGRVRALIGTAGVLAFGALPDAFLALWAFGAGLSLAAVPLVWAAASAVRALVVLPLAAVSDRLGRMPVVVFGWSARVAVLLGMMLLPADGAALWALFLAYAGASACTEGAERALLGDLAPAAQRGSAFGVYHMTVGLAALPGAMLYGWVWQRFGPTAAFGWSALLTAAGAGALALLGRRRPARA